MAKNNPKKTKDKGIPKLDRFIRPEKQKWYATYSQVASYYSLPYYTAVQLARQANANFHIMKNAIVDMDVLDAYMESIFMKKGE